MMNYDPNLTNSGNCALQTVKLIFAVWEYRTEMTAQIGGNCRGLTVIRSAVSRAFDDLPVHTAFGHDIAELKLTNANGAELLCGDDDEKGEDWLEEMLISAEIIAIEPVKEEEESHV